MFEENNEKFKVSDENIQNYPQNLCYTSYIYV